MDFKEIAQRVVQKFPGTVCETPSKGEPFVKVPPTEIRRVGAFLRDEPELEFEYLSSLSGVDWPDRKEIEVVYHLLSLTRRHGLAVKAVVPREAPELPSVEEIWPAANWHERECWDLFGVAFTGHSDLRRILLPDDWEGHPLRKDYRVPESWHGMKVQTEH